jgi:hypothetical protein
MIGNIFGLRSFSREGLVKSASRSALLTIWRATAVVSALGQWKNISTWLYADTRAVNPLYFWISGQFMATSVFRITPEFGHSHAGRQMIFLGYMANHNKEYPPWLFGSFIVERAENTRQLNLRIKGIAPLWTWEGF